MGERRDGGDGGDEPTERPWKFTQWFRKLQSEGSHAEATAEEANYITAVEFDESGDFLATGDKSGNIVILQNDAQKAAEKGESVHYGFFSEFQSHQIEFDFVRSLQVDERINQIKWGPQTNDSLFLLATNDRQIKLWKVTEREPLRYVNWNIVPSSAVNMNSPGFDLPALSMKQNIVKELRVPKIVKEPLGTVTSLKKQYFVDAHSFNVTNLSISSDKENFMSGDTLKINLWDMHREESCFTVVDITPEDLRELREIITTLDYHPTMSHMFLHGTNMGKIRLSDLRMKALAKSAARTFSSLKDDKINKAAVVMETTPITDPGPDGIIVQEEAQDQQTLFDEVTSGVSDAKFSHGGRFIISRDYMSIKIWDMNYEKRPVETIYVHEFLREKLFELYQSDLLWDGFGLGVSSRGDIVTGTYSNCFHIIDLANKKDVFVEASKAPERRTDLKLHCKKRHVNYSGPGSVGKNTNKKPGFLKKIIGGGKKKAQKANRPEDGDDYPHKIPFEHLDFNKKILNATFHPETNAVAVAGLNNLYVYSK